MKVVLEDGGCVRFARGVFGWSELHTEKLEKMAREASGRREIKKLWFYFLLCFGEE